MPSGALLSVYATIFTPIAEDSRGLQIMKPTRKGKSTLKRLLLSVLFVSVFFFAVQPRASAQQPAHLSVQATDLPQLRTWDAFVADELRTGDLRLRSVVIDPLLPTRVVERLISFTAVYRFGAPTSSATRRGASRNPSSAR